MLQTFSGRKTLWIRRTNPTVASPTTRRRHRRRQRIAAWVGSVLEYYDFFIYGTAAALVFGKVFFPESDPATATLLSLATYGVGYVARPVGAFFMGHIGDKYGRKRVLLLTVSLMGLSTFLVGCLPTYDDIGIWAPVLLVALRLLQGLSASGEQSGANSLSLEHAPEHRRGFFTSFTLSGTQAGLIVATAVFLPIGALPEEQLLSWGWRVPFWLSAVVVAFGLLIRRRLEEPPAFREEAANAAVAKVPTADLFRDHWAGVLRVALAAIASTVSTIFGVYALSYAVDDQGPRPDHHAVGRHRDQRRRAGGDPAVGHAVRPHRAQAGVHLRRRRQRRADVRLPRRHRERQLPADLPRRRAHVRRRLQRHERHPAVALRRDVPDPRPPLGHGHRHADRLRDRRLRADRGSRDRRRRAPRLGARGGLRARLEPPRRDRRRDHARDREAAAARDRRAHGSLRAPRRPIRGSRPGRASRSRRRVTMRRWPRRTTTGRVRDADRTQREILDVATREFADRASRARAWTRSPPRRARRSG